ncbi:MAG: hypothetical protein WBW54_09165, partial [Candidatus Acidiferrales bacterium]
IAARGWASFLSEIYEDVQPEVPGSIRTTKSEHRKPRLPALSRKAGQSGRYTGNGTANAMACAFTSI